MIKYKFDELTNLESSLLTGLFLTRPHDSTSWLWAFSVADRIKVSGDFTMDNFEEFVIEFYEYFNSDKVNFGFYELLKASSKYMDGYDMLSVDLDDLVEEETQEESYVELDDLWENTIFDALNKDE